MNIIEAINTARDRGVNVRTIRTISHIDGPFCNVTYTAPGLINPDFLLTKLATINTDDLLNIELWDVEEKKVVLTRSQYFQGMRDTMVDLISERKITFYPKEEFERLFYEVATKYWKHLAGEKQDA